MLLLLVFLQSYVLEGCETALITGQSCHWDIIAQLPCLLLLRGRKLHGCGGSEPLVYTLPFAARGLKEKLRFIFRF